MSDVGTCKGWYAPRRALVFRTVGCKTIGARATVYGAAVVGALVYGSSMFGCASGDGASNGLDGNSAMADGGNAMGSGNGGSGNGGSGNGGSSNGSSGGSGTALIPGQECAADIREGELTPIDLHVMMDRSVSMGGSEMRYLIPNDGGTKWAAVRRGFEAFVDLPEAEGIGMSIDFFGTSPESCDVASYATPEVNIAELPGVGSDILASYDSFSPGDNTPLTPALRGAIRQARGWQRNNADRQSVVVLVTDGNPNGCDSSFENLRQAAEDGVTGDPSVKTFVLGITGQELNRDMFQQEMRRVAEAGETTAVLIDADSDLAQEFSAGLDAIREAALLPCSYGIPEPPPGETLDFNRVNVQFTAPGSDVDFISKVSDEASCSDNSGWYYDNDTAPTSIELCPSTCTTVSAQRGAKMEVLLGCETVLL